MPYKGDTWYRKRGKKNYPRFFFHNIFEEPQTHTNYWDRHIIKDLPGGPAFWSASFNPHDTELSKYSIVWKSKKGFGPGLLEFEIGLYRDGFHIRMRSSNINGIPSDRYKELKKDLFDGDINRDVLWTQDYTIVASMVNELFDRINEHFR